jgi:hypothetical protein
MIAREKEVKSNLNEDDYDDVRGLSVVRVVPEKDLENIHNRSEQGVVNIATEVFSKRFSSHTDFDQFKRGFRRHGPKRRKKTTHG